MDKIMSDCFQSRKRVALYLRLSREDIIKDNPNSKSESIKNQERMLREKAEHEGWEIYDIYIDEDYSGIDSQRPDFNRMLKDCENGKIDIVLCKSQSRFSRDMEIIEKYIHGKFMEWNVRFIGIVDNADTDIKGNKKSRQINALSNQWYVEEASDNLRLTLRNKKENGLFTGAFAPYGYMKDPVSKNHLIVDPVAAEIVKEIFDLYVKGWGYAKIVKYLHEKKIPCPSDYKRKNGMPIATSVRKNNRKDCIEKKGGYVLKNYIENNTLNNFENVCTLNYLQVNGIKESFENLKVTVRKLDVQSKLFVSTSYDETECESINLNDTNNWEELKENDEFPIGTKCFVVSTTNVRLKTTHSFEIEVILESTSNDKEYTIVSKHDSDLITNRIEYQPKFYWSTNTIKEIIQNEIYIGNLVQGKYENVSCKIQKSKRLSKDKWIIVKNTHEAIIDKTTWLEAQSRKKKRTKSDHLTGEVNPLSKKVYCSICGGTFEKTCGTGHRHEYMVCRDNRYFWEHCDNKKMIRYDILTNLILEEMNQLIKKYKDDDLLKKESATIIENNIYTTKISGLKNELKDIEVEKEKKAKYFQQLYEDRVEKIITEEQFKMLSSQYQEDVKKLEERFKAINEELELLYIKESKQVSMTELFKNYNSIDTLTTSIVEEWIDKIVIGKMNLETGDREVKILWNFSDINV